MRGSSEITWVRAQRQPYSGSRVIVVIFMENGPGNVILEHAFFLEDIMATMPSNRPPEIKYVLIPGHILSRTDGDEHYISAAKLAELYGVDLKECDVKYYDQRDFGKTFEDLIKLTPRSDGNYRIPKGRK